MKSQFLRFLVGGAINTALTYTIFIVLSWFMHAVLAYTITYVIGIAISYAINVWLVFKRRPSVATAAAYPVVYLVQYLFGLGALTVLMKWGVTHEVAMLVVIVMSIPLTFVLTRTLLRGRPGPRAAP